MRIVPPPADATPEEIAEHNALEADLNETFRIVMEEMKEEKQTAPILKAVRVDKARKRLKKDGIDHLVDL